jgi:hypothetical protein
MEKYISNYELAIILKSIDGENGHSKLADIIMGIQEEFGDIPELEGYGWWPLEDIEEVYIDKEGFEETDVTYAYDNYCELPTRVAVKLINKWYPNGKFFYDLNEEAIEILEDLRKRHGKKYRWRTVGKEVAKEKRRLRKIEFEDED